MGKLSKAQYRFLRRVADGERLSYGDAHYKVGNYIYQHGLVCWDRDAQQLVMTQYGTKKLAAHEAAVAGVGRGG